jgi:hypothetical protein
MKPFKLSGLSLIAAGLLMTACSGDEDTGACGKEMEVITILTADDIRTFSDSVPEGYGFSSWRTNLPSTHFNIHFKPVDGICTEKPVKFHFEASYNQVPYEGDVKISGIARAGGNVFWVDLGFVAETTKEIRFSADTVLELGNMNFFGEEPSFFAGVTIEVGTGGSEAEDLVYLLKVIKQAKVTVSYNSLKE